MCFCGLSARLHSSKVLRCQTWRSLQSAIEKRELSQLLSLIYYPRSRYTLRYASSVRHISKISTWVLLQILKKKDLFVCIRTRAKVAQERRVCTQFKLTWKNKGKKGINVVKERHHCIPWDLTDVRESWRTLNYVQVQQRWKCQEGLLYISSVFSFTFSLRIWKSGKV